MAVVHDERVLLLYGHPLGDGTRFGGGYPAVINDKEEVDDEARRSDET
jgi:hypothetical protein